MRSKNIKLIIIIGITTLCSLNYYFANKKSNKIKIITMQLTSPSFANGSNIPPKYTCDGENINPPLVINKIPKKTKSLVLVVNDPDAPSGNWLHWSLWNIPATTKEIKENSIPTGTVIGNNDFSLKTYRGPCPPSGTHRYFFKLYALDSLINLPPGANISKLEAKIKNHIIEKTELIGKYKKQL